MSSISDLVAFDGDTTPTTHTFKAQKVSVENGVAKGIWKEVTAGVPVYAQGTVEATMRELGSGIYRASIRVSLPVMESISGQNSSGYTAPPKVAYVDTVECTGYFSPRSTVTGRRRVRQLATNILGGIATTVTPVTTGPAAELLDLLLMPT